MDGDARELLGRQLDLIGSACRDYDGGARGAALQIGAPVAAILHAGPAGPSLLAVGKAWYIHLLSTLGKRPPGDAGRSWLGLVHWELDPGASLLLCRPKLDASRPAHRPVSSSSWWEGEAIYQHGPLKIRRRDLVLAAAGLTAGTPDASLPAHYAHLVDGSGWKLAIKPGNDPERQIIVYEAHLASLRQIGHEVLHSPELLKLSGR
jgi:hypothetical protein